MILDAAIGTKLISLVYLVLVDTIMTQLDSDAYHLLVFAKHSHNMVLVPLVLQDTKYPEDHVYYQYLLLILLHSLDVLCSIQPLINVLLVLQDGIKIQLANVLQ